MLEGVLVGGLALLGDTVGDEAEGGEFVSGVGGEGCYERGGGG